MGRRKYTVLLNNVQESSIFVSQESAKQWVEGSPVYTQVMRWMNNRQIEVAV